MMDPKHTTSPGGRGDQDFAGLGKKHPYLLYLAIVGGLFLFLILMGYLAVSNGWIPDRGVAR